MRRGRDAATAEPLKEIWRVLGVGNLIHEWRDAQTEAAFVLGDALSEQGFSAIAKDLSRFAKRMARWRAIMVEGREQGQWGYGWYDKEERRALGMPELPKWEQWQSIRARIQHALRVIEAKRPATREWHQRRPHMAIVVLSPRWRDQGEVRIDGPFSVTPRDVEDITTLRKWLVRKGYPPIGKVREIWKVEGGEGARHSFEKKGTSLILYPLRGPWGSIAIELGRTGSHLAGRSVVEMAEILKLEGFLRPNQYARMLHRGGFTPERLRRELGAPGYAEAFAQKYNFRRATYSPSGMRNEP